MHNAVFHLTMESLSSNLAAGMTDDLIVKAPPRFWRPGALPGTIKNLRKSIGFGGVEKSFKGIDDGHQNVYVHDQSKAECAPE